MWSCRCACSHASWFRNVPSSSAARAGCGQAPESGSFRRCRAPALEANHILKLLDKSGSLDSLKVLSKCGFRPLACQTRCTDALLTPQSSAMRLQLHCVACAGAVCVLAIISASLARAKGRKLRPRGRSSYSAATPPSAKRRRQSSTVGREVPSSLASALFDLPSAAPRTIRARSATRCSVLPERAIRSSSCLLSGVAANAELLVHMPRSITHANHIVKLCVRYYTRWSAEAASRVWQHVGVKWTPEMGPG